MKLLKNRSLLTSISERAGALCFELNHAINLSILTPPKFKIFTYSPLMIKPVNAKIVLSFLNEKAHYIPFGYIKTMKRISVRFRYLRPTWELVCGYLIPFLFFEMLWVFHSYSIQSIYDVL